MVKNKSASPKPKPNIADKIAKAAISREMLAAGLTAAAAAIAASPKARRAIRDAGLDAADSTTRAANEMVSSASKLGALIAEAVSEAAKRVLSDNYVELKEPEKSSAKKPSAKRKVAKRGPPTGAAFSRSARRAPSSSRKPADRPPTIKKR